MFHLNSWREAPIDLLIFILRSEFLVLINKLTQISLINKVRSFGIIKISGLFRPQENA
jgi:hypothetical protein